MAVEASHSASRATVAHSSPRRLPAGVVAIVTLVATLALGCTGFYPGMATTKITYYDSQGRVSAVVEHTTSWRQASVMMPGPLPELRPLEAHSEEYALALMELYNRENGAEDPTPTPAQAADPVREMVYARMIWIDHKAISGKGGLEGAWGALTGLLAGLFAGTL